MTALKLFLLAFESLYEIANIVELVYFKRQLANFQAWIELHVSINKEVL